MIEARLGSVMSPGSGLCLSRAGAAERPAVEALQQAAYAANRDLLGVDPVPLQADYGQIFAYYEVWVASAEDQAGLQDCALILDTSDAADLLIWSVATRPGSQGRGLGAALLAAAEDRARALGRKRIRLYTGAKLRHLVAWYGRHGYVAERHEQLSDRVLVHMMKQLN